jgi:hypothetical protein
LGALAFLAIRAPLASARLPRASGLAAERALGDFADLLGSSLPVLVGTFFELVEVADLPAAAVLL